MDDNLECSLIQLKVKMKVKVPSVTINTSIDRLLDDHAYKRQKLIMQPAEHNRLNVK